MNWSDLERIWSRQKGPTTPALDLSQLRATFEAKRRKLALSLFLRDVVEAAAGLVVAVFIGRIWWQQGAAYWPVGIALALILGVTGFFVRERIRAYRSRLGAEAPMLAKLEADIAELQHQRRLLLNVGKWYIGPLMLAVLIVVGTNTVNHWAEFQSLRPRLFLAGYLAFCAFLAWRVSALNRRGVRKKIEPRLAELEKLRDEFLSS